MVMVTSCAVPSTVVAVNVSVSVLADIERLHGGIVVVERVGPEPGRCQRVAAVAAGARASTCRPRVQASAGLSTSVEFRSPVAVGVPGVPLATPPASTTLPVVSPVITAASFGAVDGDGHQLRGAVDRDGGEACRSACRRR